MTDLNLRPELQASLERLGFTELTEIQTQSLPIALNDQDLIAQAKTGSGKTVAFGLSLLQSLQTEQMQVQALVLCPTRELAEQVAEEIRRLAVTLSNLKLLTLCGGKPFKPQATSLEYGAHIIVGTPGRVEDHLTRGTLSLDALKTLVLDEADRMLDMGFEQPLKTVVNHTPKNRQTLLFSATFPDSIAQLSKHILNNPAHVKVESLHDDTIIRQHFFEVADDMERIDAVQRLLMAHKASSAVVFCNTKKDVQMLAQALKKANFDVGALHGDLEQRERDQMLTQFTHQSLTVLVATDVAARGLDIDSVEMVINYHLAHDPEVHVHRIGRTGRAGKSGLAFSLFTPKQDYKMAQLSEYLGSRIQAEKLPDASVLKRAVNKAPMGTLIIDAGKKNKLRPGDILGALTAEKTIEGHDVGKIKVTAVRSYVSVKKSLTKKALQLLTENKVKGKKLRARIL